MVYENLLFRVGAVSGALAVALSAYGSHGFKPSDPYFNKVFQSAQNIHMLHSLLLLTSPLWKNKNLTGGLVLVGTLLFSGSCYLVAFTENRSYGKLAPYGGMSLIFGWLTLAL